MTVIAAAVEVERLADHARRSAPPKRRCARPQPMTTTFSLPAVSSSLREQPALDRRHAEHVENRRFGKDAANALRLAVADRDSASAR